MRGFLFSALSRSDYIALRASSVDRNFAFLTSRFIQLHFFLSILQALHDLS